MSKPTSFSKRRQQLFWSHVEKTPGCWRWTAFVDKKGYGQVGYWDNGKTVTYRAHRVAYMISRGTIPPGLLVLHSCDNPRCVRPDHLRLGTLSDNVQDMLQKRRNNPPIGDRGRHSLSNDDVRTIRLLYRTGILQADLATQFGVHNAQISKIVNRKQWKHI